MATVKLPTIHLNGSSQSALVEQLETASNALRTAIDALAACEPNGRDYYPQGPAAHQEAMREHASRLARLITVRDELSAIWEGIA